MRFQWSFSLPNKTHEEEQPMSFLKTEISQHGMFCESFQFATNRREAGMTSLTE